MAGRTQPWKCNSCGNMVKGSQTFCGLCGQPWYAYTAKEDSWSSAPWRSQAKSPRRRVSPRRRQPDPGTASTVPKAPAKGGKGGKPHTPQAPQAAQLPLPPEPEVGPGPKAVSAPALPPQQTEEQKLLAQLAALVPAEKMSPDLQAKLGALNTGQASVQGKILHKLVSAQTEVRKELEAIRTQKATYASNWEAYLRSIEELLQQQFKERAVAMEDFAQVETQWASKLASVSAQLAAATTGETPEGMIDLTEDEVAEAAKAESEVRMDVDRETKAVEARQQCLTTALNTALKDASESAAKAANDARERTPRRSRKSEPGEKTDESPPG
ncbi:PUF3 [Symbiodinium natans]|uniref:PUF3 protein n=1 Tax=Symbiodinium natans TaxID=878477 RepID=A0A812NFY9_9DINO|nr:PUF3 [Symbiodinium natans]